MSDLGAVIARIATVVPLTLLVLALGFMVVVAVIRPTPERQAMVDHLARAIKEVGAVILGRTADNPSKITNRRRR